MHATIIEAADRKVTYSCIDLVEIAWHCCCDRLTFMLARTAGRAQTLAHLDMRTSFSALDCHTPRNAQYLLD